MKLLNHLEDAVIKPDFANASYNIGNILLEQDKLSEAIDFYAYCIKINPDFTEAYCNLGVILKNNMILKKQYNITKNLYFSIQIMLMHIAIWLYHSKTLVK